MENKEQLFGTKAIESKLNFLSVMKRMFTLQDVKFWLLTYLVSFIIFYLFRSSSIFIDSVNFILFPFTVITIGTIANQFIFSIPLIYRLLYPTYKYNLSDYQNKVIFIIEGGHRNRPLVPKNRPFSATK